MVATDYERVDYEEVRRAVELAMDGMERKKDALVDRDLEYLHHAIRRLEKHRAGNLPVGAIMSLDGKMVVEGTSSIQVPRLLELLSAFDISKGER